MRGAWWNTWWSEPAICALEGAMPWWSPRTRVTQSSSSKAQSLAVAPDWFRKLDALQLALVRPTTLRPGALPVRTADSAQGFEVHGYRPYTWGDDLRFVDWNAYARLGEPMVRRFRAERESATYVLLDASASMATGHPLTKFAFAQQLVAALAYLCLRRHEPVMLVVLVEDAPRQAFLSPVWSHRQRFLEAWRLVQLLEARGATVLRRGVEQFVRGPLLPGVAFVVSDFLVPPEEAETALSALRVRGLAVVALHVVSEADPHPFRPGRVLRLRDAETGIEQEVQWDSVAQAAYENAWNRHLATIRETCIRYGIVSVRVDASRGIERCMFETLTQAGIFR